MVIAETPAVQIEVMMSAFDVTPDMNVLAASWTIVWPGDAHTAAKLSNANVATPRAGGSG